jgi:endonuclease/exonuclease/phosphatase family metal-dependent hydrolase
MPGMERRPRAIAVLVAIALSAPALASQDRPREPLTVMSFNVRYGTAGDGENAWMARRELLFDTIRRQDADVIGLQEALDFQIEEIVGAAPVYAVVGVGRDDGGRAGEFSAILYRKDRLYVAQAGSFWFSDTPAEPASKSWGNDIPRICSWARLVDRDGRGFWLYNVHLDHVSQPSRERSTELLRQRIDARSPQEPVIVTGDFNAGEDNPAMVTLTGTARAESTDAPPPALVDTFRFLHPDEAAAGTFNGFKFGNVTGDKIDYILVQPGTEVIRAEIDRSSRGNRYPSDHFPVVARVKLVDR